MPIFSRGHAAAHFMQFMHSPESSLLYSGIDIEHLLVQSRQSPHSLVRFSFTILNFASSENIAPSGQKYLQNARSTNSDTIAMSRRSTPPAVNRYSAGAKLPILEYIPNTVHGLHTASPNTAKIHTATATNASTAYLKYFIGLSIFSGMRSFTGMCFPIAQSKSCIAPNEQM